MRPLVRGGAPVLRDLRRRGSSHWRLRHVQVCTSTELELVRWLERQTWSGGQPRAVFATHQTQSHGQHGRAWSLAHRIDGEGAAEVWCGPLEQAELYHQQLGAEGLTMAPIERC